MRRMDGSEEEVGHDGYPVGSEVGNIPGLRGQDDVNAERPGTGSFNPSGDIADTGNSETPRERGNSLAEMNPNVSSTPRKPMTPDIGAGSVETHSGGDTASGKFTSRPSGLGGGMGASTAASQGVIPFRPMSGGAGSPMSMSGPIGSPGGSKSTLFGMAGGLKGGGLGVPSIGDIGGTDSGGSSLIDSLMSILKQKKGGMF